MTNLQLFLYFSLYEEYSFWTLRNYIGVWIFAKIIVYDLCAIVHKLTFPYPYVNKTNVHSNYYKWKKSNLGKHSVRRSYMFRLKLNSMIIDSYKLCCHWLISIKVFSENEISLVRLHIVLCVFVIIAFDTSEW